MSLMSKLYKLNKKDIKKAADVLVSAYTEDPVMKKIFKEEDMRRIQFEVMLKFCIKYGNVFAPSDNFEGVMSILPHDKGDMTVPRIIRSGGFLLSLKLMKFRKMMEQNIKAIEEVKKNLDIGAYIYLFVIGVQLDFQGKGFGGKMLRAVVEKADTEGKPIYLETQTETNVSLYEKYGFYVYKKKDLPEPMNLPFWFMIRDAK
ncbi:MAG: GNAT family N-acetyltransferase [Candidatus Hodarchaeales archaeon]|jgi:ribosomal protein S18 acetylase RimI-like enzyme